MASGETPAIPRRRMALAAVGAFLVLAADQLSKAVVRAALPLHKPRAVIPGFFNLRYELNDGAAWSILRGARWPLVAVSAAVLAFLVWNRREMLGRGRVAAWAFALLCGGILGNLVDRLLTGRVVDFLDFVFGTYHYPTFNVADSAICVGMVLYLFDALLGRPEKR